VHVSDELARELHATARPGKGELLVQVFSEAAGAFAAGDYEESIRLGQQAKHMALRSVAARELLGLALYRAGQYAEAARELSTFKRFSGSTEQNPIIADCYRAMKRPDKALELCDEVKETDVSPAVYFEAQIVGAGALADLGREQDAVQRLENLDLNPTVAEEHHLRTWYFLADLLERRGRFTQAKRWFEAVAGADPSLTDAPDRAAALGR
jgi:tetratricopeptide (TPR) repeat protein